MTSSGVKVSRIQIRRPRLRSSVSVEEAIVRRRSTRDFASKPITLQQLSQLFWAAQGLTNQEEGLRASPSAGALYPLEIYAVVRDEGVASLDAGVYHYLPEENGVELIREDDRSYELLAAALDQDAIRLAAVNIVMTAVFERTTMKYGNRGIQYVFQESGHAAQNICLQAEALGLSSLVMGAFDENRVRKVIGARTDERPIYIIPVGVPHS